MDRKTFIRKTTVGLLIGIPAVSILGCSSDDDGGGPNPNPTPTDKNCVENGTNTSVSSADNHTHNLTVPKEDVSAGASKTYDLSLSADHIHQVTLSAANFQALKDSPNQSITLTSTLNSGHNHNVTVSCA